LCLMVHWLLMNVVYVVDLEFLLEHVTARVMV
jgi:hypothetical protein